jgi:hypothetical protein
MPRATRSARLVDCGRCRCSGVEYETVGSAYLRAYETHAPERGLKEAVGHRTARCERASTWSPQAILLALQLVEVPVLICVLQL